MVGRNTLNVVIWVRILVRQQSMNSNNQDTSTEKTEKENLLWIQSVSSQHQMWATVAGFAINGLFIFITFKSVEFILTQKVLFTASIISLAIQVVIMTSIAQIERSTAWQENMYWQETENILRSMLNFISILSWFLISILLVVSIWI